MNSTAYSDLNSVLQELVDFIQSILAKDFTGAYLQGSFAVGDFDQHSDVDFIIAIEKELLADQVQALQVMHNRVFNLDSPWAQHLEGSYFPKGILKDYTQRSHILWYLDNGNRSLIQSDHCNTIVVRWTLREHGIVLAGPSPSSLVDPIPVNALREDIFETINDWGKKILSNPEPYNNRFYQSFIVLSYCRMLHDLLTGTVSSKRASAEWAKANLDPSWNGLIDRTWAGRPNPEQSVRQPADPKDFQNTLEFIRYVTHLSNRYAAEQGLRIPSTTTEPS